MLRFFLNNRDRVVSRTELQQAAHHPRRRAQALFLCRRARRRHLQFLREPAWGPGDVCRALHGRTFSNRARSGNAPDTAQCLEIQGPMAYLNVLG